MTSNKKIKLNTKVVQSHFRVSQGSNCPAEILSSIPDIYESIQFTELTPDRTYQNKCIIGKIEYLTDVKSKQKNYHLRKCLLSDALAAEQKSSDEKLSVFLFDGFAVDSTAAEVEGFLAISNFHVENLTLACHTINDMAILPVQVIVKDPNGTNGTSIWIAKKVPPHVASENSSQKALKEKTKANADHAESSSSATASGGALKEKRKANSDHAESSSSTAGGGTPKKKKKKTYKMNDASGATKVVPSRTYTYVPLNKLSESRDPKMVFNIYAVVKDCFLRLKQDSSHSSSLDLVLYDSTKSEFSVTLFSGKGETFPDVHPGDVVRIHRMVVHNFRGKLKGRCCSSKFLVVFGLNDKGSHPKSVAKSFTFTDDDKNVVANMFLWAEKKQWKLISDIAVGEFVNVICQVVSIYVPLSSDSILLTIWDGTKSDKIVFEHRNLSNENTDKTLFNVAKGYLVHLWINGNYAVAAAELKPRQFIKVLNAQLYCPKGGKPEQSNLCIHPQFKENRGIICVDDDDDCLLELKSRLAKIHDQVSQDITSHLEVTDDNCFFLNCDISASPLSNDILKEGPLAGGISPVKVSSKEKQSLTQKQKEANNISKSFQVLGDEVRNAVEKSIGEKQFAASDEQNRKGSVFTPIKKNEFAEKKAVESKKLATGEIVKEIGTSTTQERQLTLDQRKHVKHTVVTADKELALSLGELHEKKSTSAVKVASEQGTSRIPQNAVSERPSYTVQDKDNNEILSVINAGIQPGQYTQAFGSQNLESSQFPSTFGSLQEAQDESWISFPTVSVPNGHSNIKPSTLNEVVSHSVPYKFRILATVLNFQPEADSIKNIIRLYCPNCDYLSEDSDPGVENEESEDGLVQYYCPNCATEHCSSHISSSMKLEYTYLLSFSIHDGSPSDAIDVFLWRDNAVKFFKDISPEEALSKSAVADCVLKMLWDICPNSRPMGTLGGTLANSMGLMAYPVLDCCIMSYTAGGVIRYQMFDTVLT